MTTTMNEPYPSGTPKGTAPETLPVSPDAAYASPDVKRSGCSPRGVTEDLPIHHHHHGMGMEPDAQPDQSSSLSVKDQGEGSSSNTAWGSFSDPILARRSIPTPSIQLAPRFQPEDASCVKQRSNLPSDDIWLPHLEEGPDYKDPVKCGPGEIASNLFPVVEAEHSRTEMPEKHGKTSVWDFSSPAGITDAPWISFSDTVCPSPATSRIPSKVQPVNQEDSGGKDHTKGNVPRLEEGPDFKDQVQYKPGEIALDMLPAVREDSFFKDQVQGKKQDNGLRTRNLDLGRWSHPMAAAHGSGDHQDSGSVQGSENPDGANNQEPALIYAVLVDGNTVGEAVEGAEYKTRKHIMWLVLFVLVAGGSVATILSLLLTSTPGSMPTPGPTQTQTPGPTPGPTPTLAPFMDPTTFFCDIDILDSCYFLHGMTPEDFQGLPCQLWVPPQVEVQGECTYPPVSATFLFNGGGCEQSDNVNLLNFTCIDRNGGPPVIQGETAFIQVTGSGGSGSIVFQGLVAVGETLAISGHQNNDDSVDFVDDDLQISIFTSDQSAVLQRLNHVSLTCSSPLELLNRYGSLQAIEFYNERQGLVSTFSTFSFAVTLRITIIILVSDDKAITTLTDLTAITSFAGDLNLTEQVSGIMLDHETPHIFHLEGNVDSSSQKNYTIIYVFEGVSNLDGSFCNGTETSWFPFGISEFDN